MHKMIYRFSLAVLALVLITGVQGVASAQQSSDKDINKTELQAFDKFLDAHPALASDIRQNPSVVNDPTYLKQHPELKGFLQNHPHAAEELKENPSAFTSAENSYEKSQGEKPATEDTGRARQEKAFDQFLDAHQDIGNDLRSNPGLANDPNYVNKHPELKGFLENHPNIKAELAQNPGAFVRGAERGEKGEANPQPKDNDKDKHKDHR